MNLTTFISFLAFVFSIFSMASFSAHSAVYFMILTFLATGLVYYIIGSTYVSMILFIVYVGAVAILFIFCVILLELKNNLFDSKFKYYAYYPLLFISIIVSFYIYFEFFQLNVSMTYFDWPSFDYNFYSKDYSFLSTFYTLHSFYVITIGLLLFFVTVIVTSILS
jgi:NADH-quinone oxidoreductase subunit J